tara:strand:+ start:263 stop:445 length:183 start_codon:yes stop_codon:yes gene_type:complete
LTPVLHCAIFFHIFNKGKLRENVGRKGAGPRLIDYDREWFEDEEDADLYKTAALLKMNFW